jgi:hypothetical protein
MNKTFELSVVDLEELKKMTSCIENQKLLVRMMDFAFQNFAMAILDKYGADRSKKYYIDTINGKINEIDGQNAPSPAIEEKPVEDKPIETPDKGL